MLGPVVILGLGFATRRLAVRLRQRSISVYAAVRGPERFAQFAEMGVHIRSLAPDEIPTQAVLVHSVPSLGEPDNSAVRSLIAAIEPDRILYISSTGVYGSQTEVNAETLAAPNDDKGRARLAEEQWLAATCASSLILRSAAIYGPERGIHVRLREGKLPRGAGGVVSRIHVDDLVSILEAGIESSIHGEWPVADDYPAASREVTAWSATLLGLPLPAESSSGFPVSGRCVDGGKIREILGVELKYPSYHTGIPASLEEEKKKLRQ